MVVVLDDDSDTGIDVVSFGGKGGWYGRCCCTAMIKTQGPELRTR